MISSFAIIVFAALIHASFQLSVSMLTLLSGHAIGAKTAHSKLLRLTNMFSLGVALMTMLVLSFIALVTQLIFGDIIPPIAWAASCENATIPECRTKRLFRQPASHGRAHGLAVLVNIRQFR